MASLRELQLAFIDAVLLDDAAPLTELILPKGIPADRRLAIYRNNVREGFTKALRSTFPAVEKLGGEAWFRQIAHSYWHAHPSSRGDLHYAGIKFAEHLRNELAGGQYQYFADVAQLEWEYHDILVAADAVSLDLAALAMVPEEQHERLIFEVHPAVRWLRSKYPVFSIWDANRAAGTAPETEIRLDGGASQVLLIRRPDHVEVREVAVTDLALLDCFASHATLGAACEVILESAPDFDLGATLARLAQWDVFARFKLQIE